MQAIVVESAGEHGLKEVPYPDLSSAGRQDAIVKVSHVALCGSDRRLLTSGLHDADYPVVPGHEWVGIVTECPAVPGRVGQRVVGSNFILCGECEFCETGKPELCPDLSEIGFDLQGACAEYVRVPFANLRDVPPGISDASACLIEPLCVALHASKQAGPLRGLDVRVLGGGAVGALVAQVASVYGASSVSVVDPQSRRRGALAFLTDIRVSSPVDQSVSASAPQVIFDCTGDPQVLSECLSSVRKGGTIVVVGYTGEESVRAAPGSIMLKQLTVVGSLSGVGQLDEALHLVHTGQVLLEELVDCVTPLHDYADTLQIPASRVVLTVGDHSHL